MLIKETEFDGLLLIETDCHEDPRGFFMETWHKKKYQQLGLKADFVQDNLSYSSYGVIRGLHFQHPYGQGKLVYVIEGEIYDVVVDIRRNSPTFAQWAGYYLSGKNRRQIYIPVGFAHGFCVTSATALFAYKCTDYYKPETEKGILWNDPYLKINWPIAEPILSDKDLAFPLLNEMKEIDLPVNEG